MHDRLVRLVLEVRFPALGEVRRRPPLKVLELLLSRPDLDTSIDTVGGKGSWQLFSTRYQIQ